MGSSPLARGGPSRLHYTHAHARLIPARAGRTSRKYCWLSVSGAHPRSRGEDASSLTITVRWTGSSPLARGGPGSRCPGPRCPGLIPARAGRTPGRSARHPRSRAHPRSRGEDSACVVVDQPRQGSSPLARGGHRQPVDQLDRRGLIPARAGRTPSVRSPAGCSRAHPRSRGEDGRFCELNDPALGSSPLARGGPPAVPRRWGSPGSSRSRGEDGNASYHSIGRAGSSPLARGGPGARSSRRTSHGLIPARAGRTSPTTCAP